MISKMDTISARPAPYAQTGEAFWDDDYISEQMLKAHLDPAYEGASRKLEFIEKSVRWIQGTLPPAVYLTLLDVGCGPGLYAERFTKAGFQVTGIDFSRRSISYAKNSALAQGLPIEYIYHNYLELNLRKTFDFATMIYCDYGVLSPENRKRLMQKIYHALKPQGKFLLDVFAIAKYEGFQEKQTWEICSTGGFWRAEKYLALNQYYKYPDNLTLEKIAILTNKKTSLYYLWNCCFTKESLLKEAAETGFKVCEIFSDVAGTPYQKNSPTLAILLEK